MLNIPGYLMSKMMWDLVVISVALMIDSKLNGVGKGTNKNATRVKSGGVGMVGKSLAYFGESPKSSSDDSCQMDW
jgi:hypothetical protein